MATLEQVEKLRQYANVSFAEAKEALEACGDNLLDAVVYLEKKGKVKEPAQGGRYDTSSSAQETQSGQTSAPPPREEQRRHCHRADNFWKTIGDLLKKGLSNHFEVIRKGEVLISIPVIVLVFLLVFTFWITLPLMIVGLFFDCTYHFRGPDLGKDSVNRIVDSASEVAEDIKKNFTKE
ncbi:DUF4342 domain-containing protein [Papillibacter cinnamivorans]|uniref:Uncharacterized protein n=1 Tax=Papillibacter cinnamivorans DSM 12816 TaxID=1122930 RepID=A0A1W2A6N7_9FIRM|nr:DUF4342 domain-containing protein [Papillibacter cinnamivorans]SMC56081.1 protein of unknown function [Papillibacter cinnamivorans DSM 12816]